MNLQSGTLLQGGKYRIETTLGQGGFGITYCGTQTALNRKVAIKEFFMKEYCERNESTSYVTLGSQGSRELVECFRKKFLKEAQIIAGLKHPHIISIYDIFEENGTAYYVMEYLDGGSLKGLIAQKGSLPESEALNYTRQLADALQYLHARKVLHLDIKPANVLLEEGGKNALLIDFGISKHYDDEGGQTSTTPIGISKGYTPLEQYKQGGLINFAPCTDIYSLGATLYSLLTGNTPPEASDVNDEGLPPLPSFVSTSTAHAIEQAMQPRRKDRPQNVEDFLKLLNNKNNIQSYDNNNFDVIENKSIEITVLTSPFLTDYSQLQVGDYYYADGSFSHDKQQGKMCIGIVFSLQTTEEEKKHRWTHGQIISLKDMEGVVEWEDNHFYCTELSLPHIKYPSINNLHLSDENGYLYTHSGQTIGRRFPAFEKARNYPVPLPERKTSGWYLPSIGQWKNIITNLGKVCIDNNNFFDKLTCNLNMQAYSMDGINSYWSSSENTQDEAWCINIDYYDPIKGMLMSRHKAYTCLHIRPVAAF